MRRVIISALLFSTLFFLCAAAGAAPFTVKVTRTGSGWVNPVMGRVVIEEGKQQVFTIEPKEGHHLVDVRLDGVSKGPVTAVTAPDDFIPNLTNVHRLAAKFAVNEYAVTLLPGEGGKITPNRFKLRHGMKNVRFSILPLKGFEVYDVTLNGTNLGKVKSVPVPVVTGPVMVSARFRHKGAVEATISGVVAHGGPCADAAVELYSIDSHGARGALLAAGTSAADGSFSFILPEAPATPVEVVASGGSYTSHYDGVKKDATSAVSLILPSVPSAGKGGLAVTPVSTIIAELGRQVASSSGDVAGAVADASYGVSILYGLKQPPAETMPVFDAASLQSDPHGWQLGLVLASLDTLGHLLSPLDPDAAATALARDISDGTLDGNDAQGAVPLGGGLLPVDAATTRFVESVVKTATCTSGGVYPAFADSLYQEGAITELYSSTLIPVYVAKGIDYKGTFKPLIGKADPPALTEQATGGYSCAYGATLYLDGNGRYQCSDGSPAVFTAQTITPWSAASVDSYLADPVTIGQPAADVIPVYTSTVDVHVFTEAERAAMNAASNSYPLPAYTQQGALTPLQTEWVNRINQSVQAFYSR